MEPGRKRLVVEIPEEAYEKLEFLQQASGKYRWALVTDWINRAYGHHMKAQTRKENTEETHE